MLREMRQAHKRDLDEIADELRIRSSYLQAIEEGRYADLPGTTYALGFVRAYADFLGFDAREAARRFKAATGAAPQQTNLVLPAPVPAGGLPTGAVLFAAAILAMVVYGGWYVLSTEGHDPDAVVSSIPTRIAEAVREALPERSTTPDSPRVAMPLKPDERQAGVPAAPPVSAPTPTSEAAIGETSVADSEAHEVDEDEDSAPGEPEQLASDAAAAATRIVIVARADAWVELRDPTGTPVYSRVMRKDDRYEVPDTPGLLMMTGNAGGIDIMVDGRATPSLGTPGSVKRNIVMDPDRLLAGTAVPTPPPPPPSAQATTPTSAAPLP